MWHHGTLSTSYLTQLYRTVTTIGDVFQNLLVVFPCWPWDSTWLDMDLQQCNVLLMLDFDIASLTSNLAIRIASLGPFITNLAPWPCEYQHIFW